MQPFVPIVALAAALAMPSLTAQAQGKDPAPSGQPRGAPAVVQSAVPGIVFVPLATLPAAPAAAANREGCEHLLARPASPAARQVAASGWAVTAEVPLGRYRAVSFVGKLEPSTSGTCQLSDGNVAIYEGEQLSAVAYAGRAAQRSLGRAVALEGVGLRLWDGDILPGPLADLRLNGDGSLSIVALAAEERRCQGRAVIPNILGMPMDAARAALLGAGWRPLAGSNSTPGSREADLTRRGITEVDGCSGTGMGFCRFNYVGAAGRLGVITAGEADPPTVRDYDVQCNAG